MLLLIDNYDSFVYNLARYLTELGQQTQVVRNDALTVAAVAALRPDAIVLSPGPCTPAESGICVPLIQQLSATIPMLGVCLGHQAIGAAFDVPVIRAPRAIHGQASMINHTGTRLFAGLPRPLRVGRYHSLIVDRHALPPELAVSAETQDGLVMALEHRTRPLWGVQFHPESVLTTGGHQLLANFLRLAGLTPGPLPPGDWRPPAENAEQLPVGFHW